MKTLVVVAEGMDPSLLRDEMRAGHLPWFSQAAQAGCMRDLDCGPVPYEPSNLATAFSGLSPGHHGCFSYWETALSASVPRVLTASDVRVPRLWDWPQMQDIRFALLNIQLTHPPFPVQGAMITYPMAATLRASHPPELLTRLSQQGLRWAHDVTVFYTGQAKEEFAAEAWRAATFQLETALALAADCDVMIVNLTLVDRLSHFLWSEVEDEAIGAESWVRRAYGFVDDACRRLQQAANGAMLVFSEIGFGGLDGFVSIDRFLQQAGLQSLAADGSVDERATVAREAVQGSHGILLSQGTADFDAVKAALLSFRFADGTPVVADVAHRDEVYPGPYGHLAPDVIIRPADPRRPPLGDPRWANHVRRTSQTGWHRDRGFVLLPQAHDSGRMNGEAASLLQIAPTIAHLAGRDAPATCSGASLVS